MIRTLTATVLVIILGMGLASAPAAAQGAEQIVLTETIDASFGKVWNAIKRGMEAEVCGKPQTEKVIEPAEEGGLYKGIYISDFCVFAQGEDTTKDVLERYGEIPRIRGGMWVAGRIQYKINVREEARNKTKIILRAELSGFEEFITSQVHFWASNGILEKQLMARILAFAKEEKEE